MSIFAKTLNVKKRVTFPRAPHNMAIEIPSTVSEVHIMANAANFIIGGNDEHGMNPPTEGKRTPVMPYINRSFYENEFNRPCKYNFLEGCLRVGFNVYDVKPEIGDTAISTRVARANSAALSSLVTFAYNAFGDGNSFNSATGYYLFYSNENNYLANSRILSQDVFYSNASNGYVPARSISILSNAGMLRTVRCPATLIEAGFMTNFFEAKLMMDPDYVLLIAEGSVRGVCNFHDVPYIQRTNMSAYPTLRLNSSGNKVKLLQMLLNEYGAGLYADGSFGPATASAVRIFQQNNDLTMDAIVGLNTWTALLNLYPTAKTIRQTSRSSNVLYLQKKLLSKLYPIYTLDGIFGAETKNAVIQFQSENGLAADGIVGPATWQKIVVIGGGRSLYNDQLSIL